eukprot:3004596-Pyramimonas_sp.AAC.1
MDYRCELRDRRAMNREIRATTIMEQNSELDIIALADTKSLCDRIDREQFASTEKRAALAIVVIRDSLENLGGQRRWSPRELRPADGSA